MSPPARAALPRRERLRAAAEIDGLFRRGVRVERDSFLLFWTRTPGPRAAAFAASRRLGGSVVRNRARRRLREAYRRLKDEAPVGGVRLAFVARRRALTAPFPALCEEVAEALQHGQGRTERRRP